MGRRTFGCRYQACLGSEQRNKMRGGVFSFAHPTFEVNSRRVKVIELHYWKLRRHDIQQQQGSYFSLSQSSLPMPFSLFLSCKYQRPINMPNIKSKGASGIHTCRRDTLPQTAPLNALATHDKPQALLSSLEFLQPGVQVQRRKLRQ